MNRDQHEAAAAPSVVDSLSCPLPAHQQTRNMLLYAVNTALVYLAAPVVYVGQTHAAMAHQLEASNKVANLPSSAFMLLSVSPVLVAWFFPGTAQLKRMLSICFLSVAAAGGLVAGTMVSPLPSGVKIAALVLHGAATAAGITTAIALMWEALARGVAVSRRGLALSLAFGVGPMFAVLGSLGSQLVLNGEVGPIKIARLAPGVDGAVVFAASVPILALAAALSALFVIPAAIEERSRGSFRSDVLGGLRDFVKSRALLLAALVCLLVYFADGILPNVTLFSSYALGEQPLEYVGYQLALRFSFKACTGLLLGWILTRSHPRGGVMITTAMHVLGIVWAMTVSGPWFLLCFGLFGSGELFGVYAPNYILSASPPAQIRRNLSFHALMLLPAASASLLFGWIADLFRGAGDASDVSASATGFEASFLVTLILLIAGLACTLALPKSPRPEE